MTKTLTTAALLLLLSIAAISQNNSQPVAEKKYRINLPDYWGHGNKVWQILTEKLPLVCEELKDREICGDDCRPKYTIDFYITEPELVGYTRYKRSQPPSTNTRILANNPMPGLSLVKGNYVTTTPPEYYNYATASKLSQTDKWEMSGEYVFQCFLLLKDDTGHVITKFILVDTNETWISKYKGERPSNFSAENPDVFFEKNKENFTPDKFELLGIVDKKILSL